MSFFLFVFASQRVMNRGKSLFFCATFFRQMWQKLPNYELHFLSVWLFVCLSFYNISMELCLPTKRNIFFLTSICLSVRLSTCLSVCLILCPTVWLSFFAELLIKIYLPLSSSVCLSIYASVCTKKYYHFYLLLCICLLFATPSGKILF